MTASTKTQYGQKTQTSKNDVTNSNPQETTIVVSPKGNNITPTSLV